MDIVIQIMYVILLDIYIYFLKYAILVQKNTPNVYGVK